jgi:hypothetical protein
MHQGFSAGKQKYRHAEVREIIYHGNGLVMGEFVVIGDVFGPGVTVNAFQVAAPCHVPDHHRLLVDGKLEQVRGQGP